MEFPLLLKHEKNDQEGITFTKKTDDSYDQQLERFRKKQRAMRAFILRKIRISPAIAEQKSRSLAFSKLRDFQAVSS